MKEDRREFLKKSLKAGTIVGIAATALSGKQESGGVVVGRSKKKEVLYTKTKEWETFYKIAY